MMQPTRSTPSGRWTHVALIASIISAATALVVVTSWRVANPPGSLDALASRERLLGDDLENLFSGVAETVRASVVAIGVVAAGDEIGGVQGESNADLPESIGSGFIIDPRGYILTNRHVIGDATTITVGLQDGREFEARVVEMDATSDVALIKIDADGLRVLPLGDSRTVRVGQWVLAVGSPFGLSQTVSAGIVSATRRSDLRILPFESYIQTDASINPGNSGGPLVNLRGEAIGINTAIYSRLGEGSRGIGFTVPIDIAKALALRWIVGKRECFLGVQPTRVDRDMARYFGLAEPRGAFLGSVDEGSPAEKGGLCVRDLVLSFDGVVVRDENHLRLLVAKATPGKSVEFEVLRDRKPTRLTVAMEEKSGPPIQLDSTLSAVAKVGTRLLGITVAPLDARIATTLGIPPKTSGLAVIEVQPSGPADKKGISVGDVIVEANDGPVKNVGDLKDALASGGPVVMLGVLRGGGSKLYFFVVR